MGTAAEYSSVAGGQGNGRRRYEVKTECISGTALYGFKLSEAPGDKMTNKANWRIRAYCKRVGLCLQRQLPDICN